ncbi:MAG TPA: fatty acid desaturase [Candidatus Saccharimonadales bacterium]|nr:fatty acid desaturase [Candidatus Saccharimonadales bacterium]
MSEVNKSKIKNQLVKATSIGVAVGVADFAATTGWMHRSLTHKSYKPVSPLEIAARTVIWGTGTRPRVWATVHRTHHENADRTGDPHSPALQGRYGVAKLFFKNTPLYSRAARAVEEADVFAPDLQPDRLDKKIFDRTNLGLAASLAGHVAVNKAVGNPSYMGAVSWAVEKAVYVTGGNLVNSLGHGGIHPFRALVTGEIEPHADGSLGADSLAVSALTLGEGNQKYHHEHPGSIYFGDNPEGRSLPARAIKDLGGTAALSLIRFGLAEVGQEAA